nr:hypothetical protein [Buchananella hordeovulneris]
MNNPMMAIPMPTSAGLVSLSLKNSLPAKAVNGADACKVSDASPAGIPTDRPQFRNVN